MAQRDRSNGLKGSRAEGRPTINSDHARPVAAQGGKHRLPRSKSHARALGIVRKDPLPVAPQPVERFGVRIAQEFSSDETCWDVQDRRRHRTFRRSNPAPLQFEARQIREEQQQQDAHESDHSDR